ncbi:MAG TPA: hypothetical protein VD884_06435 [Ohtaekwangia sp.]|nr:hypothetical protein [Ohtaekwangia sp.]
MQNDFDDLLLTKCRQLIEQKLGWGSSEIWTNQDFDVLSELIEKETKVTLSVATLKRIWGKVKYTSRPTTTTLDTLAQFIGYQNWRVFKLEQLSAEETVVPGQDGSLPGSDASLVPHSRDVPKPETVETKRRKPFVVYAIAVCSAIVILLLSSLMRNGEKNVKSDEPADFSFSSKKILTEGVPNSVIFDYDATAAGADDTIFIQQSWDERLRARVNRVEHSHASIYYYPGFFQAKLVVNDRVMKEHNLYIRSNGWVPVIEQSDVPVYFKEREVIQNGVMTIPVERIEASGIALQPETPWVAFYNARTFGELMSDNFIFETEVRNDYSQGAGVCQLTEIHIQLEGGVIAVPLSIKGCVSKLLFGDMTGRITDTSSLGCDFSDWINVRYEVRNRKGQIFIDNKKVYDTNLDVNPKKIVGLLYRFQGTGSVNFVKLSSIDGREIYKDDFNPPLNDQPNE